MLKRLEIAGFKSFARKTVLDFSNATTSIVGPNGSGKSNVAEAFRFALGEQSMKSMRGKRSEDLIFAGSHSAARANRAAVAIVFDNTPKKNGRIFPKLDFDEVSIERAVFRTGESEYTVNGSKARLRDIQELLATANIGETGHHIISQGEADRILLANPRERRSMLEDALGLKVYEFKKQEAERKLEKTEENVREVESLRREIAPHLRFLSKQVERLERAEELIRELATMCQTYFAIEERYLETEREATTQRRAEATERLAVAEGELEAFERGTMSDSEGMTRSQVVREAEKELERATQERAALSREIGRVEGSLDAAKKRSVAVARDPYVRVPRDDFASLRTEVEKQSAVADAGEPTAIHAALQGLITAVSAFFDRYAAPSDDYLAEEEQAVHVYENERAALIAKDTALGEKVETARNALTRAREAYLSYEETGREQRHRVLGLAEARATEESAVGRANARLEELAYLSESLLQEKAEAMALAGTRALTYEPLIELPQEERRVQEERKRTLERLKIRVEEAGGTGEDVRSEYKAAKDREEFLGRELEDLSRSVAGLRGLIEDLDKEIAKSFGEGLAKVNTSFGEFFTLMFGGGHAKLILEDLTPAEADLDDEDEEAGAPAARTTRPGLDITVNLPKKRVQSLMQLSGGERALTSIALIFAMSQVNPPPFLILDETDAALDEANSRRYGDMIEALAKKSQLIVITHNRETMSRAGILYGVTMGSDGISKLLSVKFEEAAAVAK